MYITTSGRTNGGNVKIAVATTDGVSLSQHFGQSKGFVVFEVDGLTVKNRELRTNDDTPHNQGICNHEGQNQQGTQGHASILDLLIDCEIVLCGGMGGGAAQSLRQAGIRPVILHATGSADDAVSQYLNGTISEVQSGFCQCQH
jgi:predicted Fe-Mo cluster-binding NifX family protein